ncbi:hypothetical protein K501DRAFT_329972 [Backusella circina FSU 941]|nr:hypothetical protein K501DRAFT_329972 [Backusella circina FSU 941]
MPTEISAYALNHIALQVKNIDVSIRFYMEVLGMKLITEVDVPGFELSVHSVGYVDSLPKDEKEKTACFYSNWNKIIITMLCGNEEIGKGYGHVAVLVDNIVNACERFKILGVVFAKELKEGPYHSLAYKFIEKWDCLDRNQAQQRFGNILSEYFKSKSIADTKIRDEYKSWISSADYIRFWSARSQSNTGDSSGNSSAPEVSDDSSAPNEPTSLNDTMLIQVRDYLISIMTNFVHEEDTNHNPWMFKDITISHLFRKYQAATSEILMKRKALPVESYVYELASLTHILFLCKDQHSKIAEKVFSLETLQQLTASLEENTINLWKIKD